MFRCRYLLYSLFPCVPVHSKQIRCQLVLHKAIWLYACCVRDGPSNKHLEWSMILAADEQAANLQWEAVCGHSTVCGANSVVRTQPWCLHSTSCRVSECTKEDMNHFKSMLVTSRSKSRLPQAPCHGCVHAWQWCQVVRPCGLEILTMHSLAEHIAVDCVP